jgi:hypothetical protein
MAENETVLEALATCSRNAGSFVVEFSFAGASSGDALAFVQQGQLRICNKLKLFTLY